MSREENQIPDTGRMYNYLKTAFEKLDNNYDKIPDAEYRTEEALSGAHQSLRRADKDNWRLVLDPYIIINLSGKRDLASGHGQVRLGGNIVVEEGEYKMFSSSLIIAVQHQSAKDEPLPDSISHCCIDSGITEADRADDPYFHILDRFHWDIDTGDEKDETKPACHFQVGGEVSNSAFGDWESYHYCSNGLDKPRFPHPPMDPVLVFNMLVEQYPQLESFEQHQWDGIVKKGEDALWRKYYSATNGMIGASDSIMSLMQP
ncbi:hypothetical protein EFA46_007655 [Halarchaeum sp. CBA1220]|uniref:hypothetical protein n=1 Tax=Halarchaeum sp. CBA1220 TaxID=1853682 RepID=UPI0011CE393D|nr:hypothetical protein [Halarchaeum sp. CBA1220]QLC34083.1 hypothetical protein EFA46_007655 [Halarchaeum sp. CBA1220]